MGIGIKTRRSSISSIFIPIEADGGNITDVEIDGEKYRIHAFTDVGEDEFEVSSLGTTDGKIDVLIVGGGGGAHNYYAGGGGAGGLVFEEEILIEKNSYEIVVGDGGNYGENVYSSGTIIAGNGDNSSAFDLTAIGGGRGGNRGSGTQPESGGSGGGGTRGSNSDYYDGASGTNGQGNSGGDYVRTTLGSSGNDGGAGGGGAGGSGNNGTSAHSSGEDGKGGDGLYYGDKFTDDFGEDGWFAGGGTGGSSSSSQINAGLGNGSVSNTSTPGMDALPNTGGGGSGSSHTSPLDRGGNGGSGIVLIRYPLEKKDIMYKTVEEYALEFDGESDYLGIPFNVWGGENINLSASIEFYIKDKDEGNHYIIGHNFRRFFWILINNDEGSSNGEMRYAINNSNPGWTGIDTGVYVNFNEYNNLTFVYDGSYIKIYLNGELVVDDNGSGEIEEDYDSSDGEDIVTLGARNDEAHFLKGFIKKAALWNKALTEQEINNYMDTPPTGNEEGLVAYYDFQDAEGDTLTDKAGSNDGTIHGAEWVKTGNMIKKNIK